MNSGIIYVWRINFTDVPVIYKISQIISDVFKIIMLKISAMCLLCYVRIKLSTTEIAPFKVIILQ